MQNQIEDFRIHPHTVDAVRGIKIQKLIREFSDYVPDVYEVSSSNYGITFWCETEERWVNLGTVSLAMRSGMSYIEAVLYLAKKHKIPVSYLNFTTGKVVTTVDPTLLYPTRPQNRSRTSAFKKKGDRAPSTKVRSPKQINVVINQIYS